MTLLGSSLLVPDPLTLQILLQAPAGYFLVALTEPASWDVPQALVEQYTKPASDSNSPYPVVSSTWTDHLTDNGGLGGNLFMLTAPIVDSNGRSQFTFTRNDRFWGQKPQMRRIDYVVSSDTVAALGRISPGQWRCRLSTSAGTRGSQAFEGHKLS